MITQPCLIVGDCWAQSAPPAAYLVQLQPEEQVGPRHPLRDRITILGRGDGCDLFINDPSVSRHHARIGMRGDRFYIHDLHSTNGTIVNDEPAYLCVLQHGDRVRLGDHLYRFEEAPPSDDRRAKR